MPVPSISPRLDSPDLAASLARMGLVVSGEPYEASPLAGGVSSDISLIDAGGRRFCVKRALPFLKVGAVWEAPVSRNAAEVAWIRFVSEFRPHAVPTVLGEDRTAGLFAMSHFDPSRHPVWKSLLLARTIDHAFAAEVGRALAAIHAHGTGEELAEAFSFGDAFEQLRLDPYLRATSCAHPNLTARLEHLADSIAAQRIGLMHGDISPKNILAGPAGPIFLDAECACYGDPAFDLAFCLNHLLLKGARADAPRASYVESFDRLARAYLAGVTWEAPAELERRAASLLPALFLARVDGKSPVEYLTETERDAVRRCAIPLIVAPPERLEAITAAWMASRD